MMGHRLNPVTYIFTKFRINANGIDVYLREIFSSILLVHLGYFLYSDGNLRYGFWQKTNLFDESSEFVAWRIRCLCV